MKKIFSGRWSTTEDDVIFLGEFELRSGGTFPMIRLVKLLKAYYGEIPVDGTHVTIRNFEANAFESNEFYKAIHHLADKIRDRAHQQLEVAIDYMRQADAIRYMERPSDE